MDTAEKAVIPAEAGIFVRSVDGSVTVDWDGMRQALKAKPLQELARMYLDTKGVFDGILEEINAEAVVKATERNQTLIVLKDGREVELKPSWSKYDIMDRRPEAVDKMKAAQLAFDAEGVEVLVYQENRRLTLDAESMEALGLKDADLVKVADKVYKEIHIPDLKHLQKAAKLGGQGAQLVAEGLSKREGGLVLKKKKTKGGSPRASAERIEEARAVPSADDFDRA